IDLDALAKYRAAVLEAFAKLLGGLLQYLKDCFCDHLLVNCPECEPDDKLYLACIAIKGGQVYQVCNFSRRKYVKTFPTVEYWFSLVPIVPLISKAFETFCCTIFPDLFANYKAPQSGAAQNKLSSQALYTVTSVLHETNMKKLLSQLLGQFTQTGGRLLRDWFACAVNDREQPPALMRENIVGLRAEDAARVLRQHNVSVAGAQSYEPCDGLANLWQQLSAPHRLNQQAHVTLVVEDGIVQHYTVTPVASGFKQGGDITVGAPPTGHLASSVTGDATGGAPSVSAPPSDMAMVSTTDAKRADEALNLHTQLSELRAQFLRAQSEFTRTQAARDDEIARLQAETQDLRGKLEQLGTQPDKPKTPRRTRAKGRKTDKPAE